MLCFIALKKVIVQRILQTRFAPFRGVILQLLESFEIGLTKLRANNFDLKDEDRSGRPATTDTDLIKSMLTENPRYGVREIVDATNISRTTVHSHLIKMGYVNRSLSLEMRLGFYIKMCIENAVGIRKIDLQLLRSQDFIRRKILCIWWDWKDVIHYKLLPQGETINFAKYCIQLDKLKVAIAKKRPELVNRRGVVFHHDNAKPHVALAVRQKFLI
ncbi:histone-lysine N-methyltransferase SETMAR-like [Vespa crabro]|uniref:histone-lysine N-methyltransferase SETMAR-like n=1 Tax=Vespa crabro TaxID=7445 RepID=UPI001F00B4D9|nr:histone-lysine N-methyltransferase SETMAR-like [Vespa crabro]